MPDANASPAPAATAPAAPSPAVSAAAPATLAAAFLAQAAGRPHQRAVVFPAGQDALGRWRYTHLTFAQAAADLGTYAANLRALGVTPGMRVVFLVRPGLEFLPLTFALFHLGAVPVLIDPGMGRKNLLRCIASVRPEAFIGIPLAHVARLLRPGYFRGVRVLVTIGRRWGWGGADLRDLRRPADAPPAAPVGPEDLAAIVFTTGSTGPPKGVEYTHGMFVAQRDLLRDVFGLTPDDVDLPGFALFALYSVAMGLTVVLPDMDPTRPALVDPAKIRAAAADHGATFSFGSPALWRRVCQAPGNLPSLRQVVMAGAPIPVALHEQLLGGRLAPGARVHTPYGATECLPVTTFTGAEVLAETAALTRAGRGTCVGRPLPGVRVRIIRIRDEPLPRWRDTEELPAGQIGEIVVQGPMVSRRYFELPAQTAQHKIYESDDEARGPFWHRIGDVGYFDAAGRLWFCGRKAHRVETGRETLFTVCCEAIFAQHPRVYRAALVGVGADRARQTPVMIVEPEAGHFPRDAAAAAAFRAELLALGAASPLTKDITDVRFHPAFPVDIRHNAKIFREKLAAWASGGGGKSE